ncbi:MAG: translocation/assembly module TamB domain-containing protein [Reinekea sp.]
MAIHIRAVAKKTWIITLRALLVTLLFIAMCIAWLIGTEGGRIVLVKQGLHAWQLWSGYQVELVGLRIPSLSHWEASQVHIKGNNDLLLELDNLALDWRWRYALQNRWWVERLNLDQVRVTMPEPEPQTSGNQNLSNLYYIWSVIPAIRVDRLHVNKVDIKRPHYPALQADLNAQLEINWGDLPARFLIAMQNAEDNNSYAVRLSADAIDQIRLRGSLVTNPDTAWAEWIKWQLPEPAEAQWDVLVDYGQTGQLDIQLDQWSMPWQSHLLQASGQFSYLVDDYEFRFKSLLIDLDGQAAKLTGSLAPKVSELSVDIEQWPLEPLAQLISLDSIQGETSVQGILHGGWSQPQFAGTAKASGLWQQHEFTFSSETQSERAVLAIRNGELTLANNSLALTGTLDWVSDQVDISVQGQFASDPVFRPWLNGPLADFNGSANVTGTIAGDIRNPAISFDSHTKGQWRNDAFTATAAGKWKRGVVTLDQLAMNSDLLQVTGTGEHDQTTNDWQTELTVNRLHTDLLSRLNIHFPVPFSGMISGEIKASGDLSGFDLSGDTEFNGQWQEKDLQANVRINRLSPEGLTLGKTTLHLADSELNASGTIDWSQQRLDLDLNHQSWPLDTVAVWLPFWPDVLDTMQVNLTGDTNISGSWNQPAIQTDTQVRGSWFDEPITAHMQTDPTSATQWVVPTLDAQWLGAQWHYQGDFNPGQLLLDGSVRISDLHTDWIPLLSQSFTGAKRTLPEGFDLQLNAETSINGKLTAPVLQGKARLAGTLDDEALSMALDIKHLDSHRIDIENASGQWSEGQWQVSGLFDWSETDIALNISTNSPDAHYLIPWLSLIFADQTYMQWLNGWQGSLQGQLDIDNRSDDWQISGDINSSGVLYDEDYQLHWQGEGQLNEALTHHLTASWGVAEGSASLVSNATDIKGDVNVSWLNYQQLHHLWTRVPDNLMGYVNANIQLDGSQSNPRYEAKLDSIGQFQAKYAHRFKADLAVTGQGADWNISQTIVEIPGAMSASLSGAGTGRNGSLLLEGVLPNTHYWITNEEIGEGEAGFQLSAKGDLLEPEVTGKLNWRASNWPISLSADLSTDDEHYMFSTALYSEESTAVKGSVRWKRLSLPDFLGQWQQVPMNASLMVNTPLSLLDPFFISQPDILLAGDIAGAIDVEGSLVKPTWQGQLSWLNGQFEHTQYGVLLRAINMTLDADADRWHIKADATDGRRGTLNLSGDVTFAPQADHILSHTMNIGAQFSNAHLLNQAQMEAALSGNLAIRGPYQDVMLSGDINIVSLNMQTDTFLADGAPQLNIVTQDDLLNAFETERPFYWPKGNWNANLIANQRVNLYGQGINAELEGNLRLTKDLYAPEISGQFDLVRGTYSALGRVFQLTEGSIQIENDQMVLDISGTNTMNLRLDNNTLQSVVVTVRIIGNQDSLALSLTSDSDLEQDELLAQILFGKIIEDLDVLQAIQLANTINKLRTGNSGFDPVGATREEIGLDSLVVDTETDEEGNLGLNISVGKYLNDYLYLEVESQVGSDREARGSLQYQLTPNTTLELYTQGQSGVFDENGLELNWSLDY